MAAPLLFGKRRPVGDETTSQYAGSSAELDIKPGRNAIAQYAGTASELDIKPPA